VLFQDIIGQQRTKAFLAPLAASGRVPHALLFLGPTGSGNLALAVAFAQMLQCERAPSTVQDACGECPACRKAAAFAHPDIHFSFPTIGTNAVSTDFLKEWRAFLTENPYADANAWLQRLGAENKQGNINKEECNAILKKLSLKTFEGRYKILLMWLPEYLGKEGNRLLKLIEEPPEQTIFLLVAENQELILNTILSRCQLVKTDLLSDEEVADALHRRLGIEAERARQVAFLAGGNFGAARVLAENPDNDDARLLLDWLRRCWRGNAVEMVRWTEEFAKLGRENQKQFLHYGLHFLREMLVLVASPNPSEGGGKALGLSPVGSQAETLPPAGAVGRGFSPPLEGRGEAVPVRLRPDELATAQNMAKVLNFEKIAQIAALFNDNIYFVERNANPKILFLDTSIQLNRIMKS
jgi:DNA polymerase III subunit delta'